MSKKRGDSEQTPKGRGAAGKPPGGKATTKSPAKTAKPSHRGSPARGDRPRLQASHADGHPGEGRVARNQPLRPPKAARAKSPLLPPRRAAHKRPALASTDVAVEPSAETRDLALWIAGAGLEKKAIGIEILEVAGKVDYADFLVIMTGRSDRHVQAIANGIEEGLRRRRVRPLSIEGLSTATWVLIDFGDVVVHVFQEDTRQVYDIEGLWIDANRVPVPEDDNSASPRPV